MPGTRDHKPVVIEDFGGWWNRGDPESAPSDHFIVADNIQFFHSGFETRDGLTNYIQDLLPSLKIVRAYNFVTQTGDTILALDATGNIYHFVGPTVPIPAPVLTIPTMEDFGFIGFNGRAYITPFKTYTNLQGEKYSLGIQNEYLYVYKGDQTPARKAAGKPPTGPALGVQNGPATSIPVTDIGLHLIAVVYETDTGYMTALGPEVFGEWTYDGLHEITVYNITVPPVADTSIIRRHLVSTKAITSYNGDQAGYQFFFIPGGTINDRTTATWTGHYYDSELISDASHLIDNFSEIPSAVSLNSFHSRLVMVGEYGTTETLTGLPPGITDNRSVARVSFPGEPEAISKIDGLIVAPLDGQALTNAQEFRDILYLFKQTRTFGYSDNNDEPVTWQEEVLDQGIGCAVHGIASVLDSGGVNTDFLIIVDWSGLMLFNGTFAQPAMSWKIEDFWKTIDRNYYHQIQIVNDSLNKKIWITLPEPYRKMLLHADYSNGMNAKDIRWSRWVFDIKPFTITLIENDKLIIGTPGPGF